MEIGNLIKRLREDREWSQKELAHRVGMSTANLSRIEAGLHGAGPELTKRLAREFELQVFELYAMADGRVPKSMRVGVVLAKDEADLLAAYRTMSKDCQRALIATAELFVEK